MAQNRIRLVGCGILKKEIRLIIRKNNWPIDTLFLDSALHVDFGRLEKALESALAGCCGENVIVFYGCCHPLMDKILEEIGTFRTEGQNCVAMLLGHSHFSEELANGAFFLLEEWALRFDHVMTKTFGGNPKLMKEMFQSDRNHLLCLRTPCSGDFTADAEAAGRKLGVPIRWMDVTLGRLEKVLKKAVRKGMLKFQ